MHATTGTPSVLADSDDARLELAAQQVYDHECALHAARQSHDDHWIEAASSTLHTALRAYDQTLATARHPHKVTGQDPSWPR